MVKSFREKTFTKTDALVLIISFIIGAVITICELGCFCSVYTMEYLTKSYEPAAIEMVAGLFIIQSLAISVVIGFRIKK